VTTEKESPAIRAARAEDFPSILSLLGQLSDAMETPVAALPERVAANIQRFMQAPDHAVFVAERRGGVLGLISLNIRHTLLNPRPVALIDELVVADSARGMGIGRRLVAEASRHARQHGCGELEVGTERANTAAQTFYRECGFDQEHVLLEMELDE
jgi:GNAT superfamily N-acetyltransferase